MAKTDYFLSTCFVISLCAATVAFGQGNGVSEGEKFFESETFGGNGRTCRTCHSNTTGTTSPADAQQLFKTHPANPLFLADGSDDGFGNGTTRIREHATIIIRVPLAPNVKLAANPLATHMTVNRGIPTTLNTPALDAVLMYDGRQPTLQAQAAGAIQDHAQGVVPSQDILTRIKNYQLTEKFFTSEETRSFAAGGPAPGLPRGNTDSEKRGRIFFEDVVDFDNPKHGFCAACHAGPMLNQTNAFLEAIGGPPAGSRFQNILISERNVIGNPVQDFVFNPGLTQEPVSSPDIGRSAITGVSPSQDPTLSHFNAFKIPTLRGIRDTGPYFHDNSAKTLEDVLNHYAFFFNAVIGLDLSEQDKKDIVAFLKLLR